MLEMKLKRKAHYIHKEYPKTKSETDFWGQISRTVDGKPVSEEQILMIRNKINHHLSLKKNDVLLDLGCGNGALSSAFVSKINKYKGVDFSEYLIEIAKKYFFIENKTQYLNTDITTYLKYEKSPELYTKALCYGVFSYLTHQDAEFLLHELATRYLNLETLYIGNLPDKDKADKFYRNGIDYHQLLDDNLAAIGIWRSTEQMKDLAENCGWDINIQNMPTEFFANHYRYEAILTRKIKNEKS